MLIWLAHWLGGSDTGAPLQLVTVRCGAAALTAFLLMLAIMPPLIRRLKLWKFGEAGGKGQGADLVDAYREGKKGTPTMGGLGLVAAIAFAAVLWCDPGEPRVWLLLGGMIGFAVVGFLDDRTKVFKGAKGWPLWAKLGIQLGTAAACAVGLYAVGSHDAANLLPGNAPAGFPDGSYAKTLGGVSYIVRLGANQVGLPYIPVEYALDLGLWAVLWSMFVTVACANGVNFTDGMDGLAAGTMLVATLAFLVIAYITSRVDTADYLQVFYISGGQEVAVFCAAIAGACLGFLWFNCAPAQVFMGDTGSQALGGLLGLVALNTKQELLVLLVGAIFVAEAASVALQIASFRLTGRRIFRCAPLHHHYQYAGMPESKIVLRFWIVASLIALLALGALLAAGNLRARP